MTPDMQVRRRPMPTAHIIPYRCARMAAPIAASTVMLGLALIDIGAGRAVDWAVNGWLDGLRAACILAGLSPLVVVSAWVTDAVVAVRGDS